MGLDITAYKDLTKYEGDDAFDADGLKEEFDDNGYFTLYKNNDFPDHAKNILHNGVYKAADSYGFRAGSYGGYGSWREMLAELAGYDESEYESLGGIKKSYAATAWNKYDAGEKGDFIELINFSDCEGVIGTEISKKLYQDFLKYKDIAADHQNEYFRDLYGEWTEAFKMASDNGCVDFH